MDALLKYIPLIFGQNPLLWAGLGAALIMLCALLIAQRWAASKGREKHSGAEAAKKSQTNLADMIDQNGATSPPPAEETEAETAPVTNDDALIEELTIPRVGQEVPEEEPVQETPAPSDAPQETHDKEMLADIERKMKALRELHDAGLIATEIYLLKSRELAKDI